MKNPLLTKEELAYIIHVGNDPKNLDVDSKYLVQDVVDKFPHLPFHIVHEAMILAIIGVDADIISDGIENINRLND
jgi:hypothetical protein